MDFESINLRATRRWAAIFRSNMIQYFHGNYTQEKWESSSYTIALETPSKEDLMRMLNFNSIDIELKVGIAKLHPSDQYNRKKGREVSLSRLSPSLFYLDLIDIKDPETYQFRLRNMENHTAFLTVHRNSNKVYFTRYI